MHLFHNITKGLLAGAAFAAFVAHAMDNDPLDEAGAQIAYQTAYAALDLVHRDNSQWAHGHNQTFQTPEMQNASIPQLLAFAENKFQEALAKGHPFAAAGLRHVYTTPETQEKLRDALRKSIAQKKSAVAPKGLQNDILDLIALSNLSTKNFDDLKIIEEIDPQRAIAIYASLATNLPHPDSLKGLEGLTRWSHRLEALIPLAEACFTRGNWESSVWWFRQAVKGSLTFNPALFLAIKSSGIVLGCFLPDASLPAAEHQAKALALTEAQKKFACLLHEYALTTFLVGAPFYHQNECFGAHLNYYKLLKKTGSDAAIRVGSLLAKLAEEHLEEYPLWLWQFCQIQDSGVKNAREYDALADMYFKCAARGIWEAAEALMDRPELRTRVHLENVILTLLQYKFQNKGIGKILQVYPNLAEKNDIFPVIFSLILPTDEQVKAGFNLVKESYPPALDLELYHQEATLGAEAMEIHDTWISFLKQSLDKDQKPVVLVDLKKMPKGLYSYAYSYSPGYNQCLKGPFLLALPAGKTKLLQKPFGGEFLEIQWNREVAQAHIAQLEAIQVQKKQYIARVAALKEQALAKLSGEELYDLAQEYDVLHRAAEIHFKIYVTIPSAFRAGYFSCLERAAQKGHEGAIETLKDLTVYQEQHYGERLGQHHFVKLQRTVSMPVSMIKTESFKF